MFKKILVANRGEIANRIFAACRELGVESIAIYSDADAQAVWVMNADYAYPLGGVTAADSYLNQDKIFAIVKESEAEAIHPGYGFLSENADFAARCAVEGVKFIGPSPEAMRLMGSKASARDVAVKAGVPVTPGVDGAAQSDAELAAAANDIGYPVLIKASAGGGGKGMRVVENSAEFIDSLRAARNEAANSFGDDHVILEKYLTSIHHIEIQVLGDEFGHVIHLFERECSIQRRHQKIIEETPSPTLSADIQHKIANSAVALAKQAGYASAGTVEFMYTDDGNYYLLEMNTRLQVEHPITELVTGVDLAQWQIRIAAGQKLSLQQADITQRGHAFECRVYAEDPANHFLPSIDTVSVCHFPTLPNVRVDAGIAQGEAVTPYYDPMLAKIITWGHDRDTARARMVAALEQTALIGVTTNIPYMLEILQEENFAAGKTTTSYLEAYFPDWQPAIPTDETTLLLVAAFEALGGKQVDGAAPSEGVVAQPDPWQSSTTWRNVGS